MFLKLIFLSTIYFKENTIKVVGALFTFSIRILNGVSIPDQTYDCDLNDVTDRGYAVTLISLELFERLKDIKMNHDGGQEVLKDEGVT